jgi:hypothetical protein
MVDDKTVDDFCRLEVEPMYHESDHIQVTALTQLTGVKVQVIYLDRGTNKVIISVFWLSNTGTV